MIWRNASMTCRSGRWRDECASSRRVCGAGGGSGSLAHSSFNVVSMRAETLWVGETRRSTRPIPAKCAQTSATSFVPRRIMKRSCLVDSVHSTSIPIFSSSGISIAEWAASHQSFAGTNRNGTAALHTMRGSSVTEPLLTVSSFLPIDVD